MRMRPKMGIARLLIRTAMVMAIVAIIYIFLNIPQIFNMFRSQRSINVLIGPAVIDDKYCVDFETKTGIKVYMTYFESYESLLVKMRSSGGGDYDLVMAGDYAVGVLLKEGMVSRIDRTKLKFWDQLYPALLGLYFDPNNEYTIPFSWEAYGLGVDTKFFGGKVPGQSWSLLFDEHNPSYNVGMLDDAREVVSITALYLFGKKTNDLTLEQLDLVKQALVKQKKHVMMYTDLRSDYLLASHAVPVLLAISSEIYQAMRFNPEIQFVLPKEGSFMVIDNFLIPATSTKQEMVYEYLNYLYEKERVQKYIDRYNFFPALMGINFGEERLTLMPTPDIVSRLRFFTYQIPEHQLRQLWIGLKS